MEIPGYYFDPEKKKYFKIPKNHDPLRQSIPFKANVAERSSMKDSGIAEKKRSVSGPEKSDCKMDDHRDSSLTQLLRRREIGLHRSFVSFKKDIAENQIRSMCGSPVLSIYHPASVLRLNNSGDLLWGQQNGSIGYCKPIKQEENICFFTRPKPSPCVSVRFATAESPVFACAAFLGSERSSGGCEIYNENLNVIGSYGLHRTSFWCLELNPSGQSIGIGATKRFVVLDLNRMQRIAQIHLPSDVFCIHHFPDAHEIACGGRDGHVRIVDPRTQYNQGILYNGKHSIFQILPTRNPNNLLIPCRDGHIRKIDIRTRTQVMQMGGIKPQINRYEIAVDVENDIVISGTEDGVLNVWNSHQSRPIFNKQIESAIRAVSIGSVSDSAHPNRMHPAICIATDDSIRLLKYPFIQSMQPSEYFCVE